MKRRFIFLSFILALASFFLSIGLMNVSADNNGKVIVHFYNGDNEYYYDSWNDQQDVRWGSYYWIDSGKIVESGTKDKQELDHDFEKEVSGKLNTSRIFRITLNATETAAVKQGKKLGLIMVRAYTDNLGYLTPYWCGNAGKDLNSDRYLSITFDSNNEFHVWIIAGDKNNYKSLNEAKSAFERIQSAKFTKFNELIIQTTKPITKDTVIQIYKTNNLETNPEGELYRDNLHASEIYDGGLSAKVSDLKMTAQDFDWHADYQVYIKDVSVFRASAIKTRLYLTDKFKNDCLPDNNIELGAIYKKEKTTFRLWAPISTNVKVNFYKTGNELDQTLYRSSVDMEQKSKGIFEAVVEGDLNGVYYTYSNFVEGEEKEVVDVYAKAVGVNGNRGMVCDMNATNPTEWDIDLNKAKNIRENNSNTAVIWEIHIRDFSIAADNGITYKGKYLAFTEDNTHAKGNDNIKTGISYLKDLGVNYVHLNPVFDFATVDEEFNNNTDYKTKQNWGYDPKNYNVPEGSYSTNAERGEVRINEFKQMVKALHNAGIGVIMDVVYNHTYTSDSYFDQTVPGYYYRQALADYKADDGHLAWTTNALGLYNLSDGSGCSNETASEREMFRKYMIDSLVYWASEYHLDGFRFDLMAIHDVKTMNDIRAALDTLPGGRGILVYGEPWAAASLGMEIDAKNNIIPANSDNLNALSSRIAAFNDRMREGIKGGNGWGGSGPTKGYVQGDVGNINRVAAGINGLFLNYSGDGVISNAPSHTITYTTSHDNYTLWDQLIYTTVGTKSPTVYSEYNSVVEKKNMLAATLTLTSKGKAFILAGEEIARTKFGNHNSYNAQDKINALDYYRQEEFSTLYNWYKGLIELRTKKFTSISSGSNQANVVIDDAYHISYTYTSEVTTDAYKKVFVLINPFDSTWEYTLSGSWYVLADGKTFDFALSKTKSGTLNVPAYSSIILVQK